MNRGRLLTTDEAAASVFVTVKDIHNWRDRRYLTPAGPGLWWELDVAEAERKTRRAPRRRRLEQLAVLPDN